MTKTEENWFLRGGKRPEQEEPKEKKTVFCPNCGGENLSDEEYCTHCGHPIVVEPRFERDHMNRFVCQNCGKPYLDGAKFCPHCGAPLTGEPSTEEYCGCDYSSCPECGAKLENPDDIDACVCPACGWEPSIVHDGPKKFFVTAMRTKGIRQEAKVCVEADDEEDACCKVEAMIDDGDPDVDDWPWHDLPGDPDYTDVLVDEAEPAE